MRLLPRSLIGQMAVLLGAALLVAQLANFALILNERQKLSLAQDQGPAITRFISVASDLKQSPPEFRFAVIEDNSRRGAQFAVAPTTQIGQSAERDASIEGRLREGLAEAGVATADVRAAFSTEARQGRRAATQGGSRNVRILLLSARLDDKVWLNGRAATPRPDPWLTARLGAATLLLYLIVLGASLFIALRIARPLGDLARAAERFGGRGIPDPVEARGPADLRRAIEAFNAMNRRVVALLDEKDRMLGAIGHDLRTPLAALRIRAETLEPQEERLRTIATIEEMATMLEDILVLARTGRAREEERTMDVTALADAIVEEYRELGRDVEMEPSERAVALVQPNLMRRAIRNLIDNAVTYGGFARVSVSRPQGMVEITIRDGGPGLPTDQLEQVLEPFRRGEESRSRETGGSGLGLAIARAVAQSHGGELRLENRDGGGLLSRMAIWAGDSGPGGGSLP